MKVEQDSGGEGAAQEKASSPVSSRTIEANPPKLTPLRWRSTSMKELNGPPHEVATSAQEPAAEKSTKPAPISSAQPSDPVRPSQVGKRPSQAQLRAQVMNSLLSQHVVRGNDAQAAAAGEPVNSPAEKEHTPEKEGSVNSSEPVEQKTTSARTELFPEKEEEEEKPVSPEGQEEPVKGQEEPVKGQEEQVKAPETQDVPSANGAKGAAPKPDMPVVPVNEDLLEEVVFQPVDLDQKYREKELVRHVTAAKIQNREEALLNNPGSPALNGR